MTKTVINTPVLIAGGGPAGSALAIELGWRGVRATVLEQSDGTVDHPRLGIILTRTMEFCRRWGIVDRVYNCGFNNDHALNVVYCTSITGYLLAKDANPSCNDMKPPPQSPEKRQRCPQIWFNPLLQKAAAEYDEVEILHFCKLQSFREHEDGVEAVAVDTRDGSEVLIRANYLVGCDGAASTVRSFLDIDMLGNPTLSYSLNIFVRCAGLQSRHDKGPAERYIFVGKDGTWANWTVVDGFDLWRITVIGSEEMMDLAKFDANQTIRACLGSDDIPYEIISVKPWRRTELTAAQFRKGRVFLVGDAAHTMSPTGGHGMSTGVADAVDLGWKLEAVLQGWGGEKLLDSYEVERRPIAALVSAASSKNFRAWVSARNCDDILDDTSDGQATRERIGQHMLKVGREDWDSLGLQLGYRYENSPICIPDGTPATEVTVIEYLQTSRPGSRAPHAWLAEGKSTLDLFGRGFVLLNFGSSSTATESIEKAAAGQRVPLQTVEIGDPAIAALYERRFVLVRPDGFVAWRGDEIPEDATSLLNVVRGEQMRVTAAA